MMTEKAVTTVETLMKLIKWSRMIMAIDDSDYVMMTVTVALMSLPCPLHPPHPGHHEP